ncbi:hypothetical protein [Variovorax sp. LT1R16]|uniref:hypothetical protein n=1 Tax=Variovorax sp. LT1R16 TaxID=3443728 RepID=UPI003F48C6BF
MSIRKKLLILILSVLIGGLIFGALGRGPLLRNKAQGILKMEMGFAEYKRFSELAGTTESVRRYAKTFPIPDENPDAFVLKVVQEKWLDPVPVISRQDSQSVPEVLLKQEQDEQKRDRLTSRSRVYDRDDALNRSPAVYMGAQISFVNREADAAVASATWLGEYFKDIAVRESAQDLVSRWDAESVQFFNRASEAKLHLHFVLQQAQVRIDGFKRILALYPDASKRSEGQVVEIRKESEKFLPASVQLVAAEAEMLKAREDLAKLDREAEQYGFVQKILDSLKPVLVQTDTGVTTLKEMTRLLSAARLEMKSDAESQQAFQMLADISDIQSRFLTKASFVAPPATLGRPERPGPRLVALLGGFAIGIFMALWLWRRELVQAGRRALHDTAS